MTANSQQMFSIGKIISGGQTGADRAALDWAIYSEIDHGGWCPKGRIAEDGTINIKYQLLETPSTNYSERTEWNVRDSDGTVIMSINKRISGGTELTSKLCQEYNKPCLHLYSEIGVKESAKLLKQFIQKINLHTLNVAGPRASEEHGIAKFVTDVLNAT